MPREPYPFLSIAGRDVLDVPQDATVLSVDLAASTTGGGNLVLTGVDGAGVSLNLYGRRAWFDAPSAVRARLLGFGVGIESTSPTPLPAVLASSAYTLVREPLDPNGVLLSGSPFTDILAIDGGAMTGSPEQRPVRPVPVGGPVPWSVLNPPERFRALLDSDTLCRYVLTFVDGAPLAANTVVRGVLVVALWQEESPS